jgi:hypothetical protein
MVIMSEGVKTLFRKAAEQAAQPKLLETLKSRDWVSTREMSVEDARAAGYIK